MSEKQRREIVIHTTDPIYHSDLKYKSCTRGVAIQIGSMYCIYSAFRTLGYSTLAKYKVSVPRSSNLLKRNRVGSLSPLGAFRDRLRKYVLICR